METGVDGVRGRHRGRARPHQRGRRSTATSSSWASASRRGPSSREAAGLARRQRRARRRAPPDQRPGRLRRRRRGQRLPPVLRRAGARRALGQRAPPRPGGGPQHARLRRALRPAAVLLLRPVRRRHGVLRLRARAGTGSCSAATPRRREFIAFWLVGDRVRGRDERQRLGRDRADPAAHPRAACRSTTGASPTRTSRSKTLRPRPRKASAVNRLQAPP